MIANRTEMEARARFDRARETFEEGDFERARKLAERGLALLEGGNPPGEASLVVEGLAVLGLILTDLRDEEGAARCYERIRESGVEHPEAWYSEGCYRLARWELEEGERLLRRCSTVEGYEAPSLDLLALLARYRGSRSEADRLYREATCFDPERCPMPVEMSDDDALALARGILESLPDGVREAVSDIDIVIEDLPDPKRDASRDTDPEMLGLYQGVPLDDRSVFDEPTLPARIRLFKHNIERIAWNEETLRKELRTTLLHEIGHHLGWDEEDLAERGLA